MGFVPSLVSCGEEDNTAFHRTGLLTVLIGPCVVNKIIYDGSVVEWSGFWYFVDRIVSTVPTVVKEDRAVIRSPDYCRIDISTIPIDTCNRLAIKDFYTPGAVAAPCNATSSYAVIVDGCYDTCYMGTMPLGGICIRVG